MIYTMVALETKTDIEDEIKAILKRYIAKHGKPPQIVETNPAVQVHLDDVPVLTFPHVQRGLIYLGEEQTTDEPNPS